FLGGRSLRRSLVQSILGGDQISFQDGIAGEQREQVAEQIDRLRELLLLHQLQGLLAATLTKVLFLSGSQRLPHRIQQRLCLRTLRSHQSRQDVFGFLQLAPSKENLSRSQFFAI